MADAPTYWTPPFVDTFVRALEADPAFQKAARKFSGTLIMRCLDAPEGKDVEARYHIDRGRVRVDLEREEAPSAALRGRPFDKGAALARTTAPYRVWTKLDKGEMSVLATLTSPDYALEGPKLKIVANIGMLNAMSAVASRLPKSY